MIDISSELKDEDSKPLNDAPLKSVLMHLDANQRFQLSNRAAHPSFRSIEKSVSLRIQKLEFHQMKTTINGTAYQLGIIRKFKNPVEETQEVWNDNIVGGTLYDLDGFEFSEENEEAGNLNLHFSERPSIAPESFKSQCVPWIQFRVNFKRKECLEYTKSIRSASKYIDSQFFANRFSPILVNFLGIGNGNMEISLPNLVQFQIQELSIVRKVSRTLNVISNVLDPLSFPLEMLQMIHNPESLDDYDHQIVQQAKRLYLFHNTCDEFQGNPAHWRMFQSGTYIVDASRLPFRYFTRMARNWIKDRAPIGTNFSAGFREKGQKVMDHIQESFGVNRSKRSRLIWIPMNEQSRIGVSFDKQNPSNSHGVPFIFKMEVVPKRIGKARPLVSTHSLPVSEESSSTMDDSSRERKDEDSKPLNYESLKSVLMSLDANKRFQLSKRAAHPSFRSIEKSVSLRIQKLEFHQMKTTINGTAYQLGIIRKFKNPAQEPQEVWNDNIVGGTPYDLDGFEFSEENEEAGNLNLHFSERPSIAPESFKDQCVPWIQFRVNFERKECLEYTKSIRSASKYINSQFFENRCSPILVHFLVIGHENMKICLPKEFRIKIQNLSIGYRLSRTLNVISNVLDASSFPLKMLEMTHTRKGLQLDDYNNQIVQQAERLNLYYFSRTQFEGDPAQWRMFQSGTNIVDASRLPSEYFTQLARNWIKDQAPIGTNFSAGFRESEKGQKVMDHIQESFGVNRSKRHNLLWIPLNEQCEIQVSFDVQNPSQYFGTSVTLKMQVIPRRYRKT
ncbi:unnamed protein product [Caenorhabditis nigoni]|uniref:Uncharacterized protein n=1 Tax=Caenorhabditis nigoni TaxID=1611254 RepID=A0A2G5UZG1_9PELO|nr:hypothetical protein B9Z55_005105 [Caenorhabditis nigoni]